MLNAALQRSLHDQAWKCLRSVYSLCQISLRGVGLRPVLCLVCHSGVLGVSHSLASTFTAVQRHKQKSESRSLYVSRIDRSLNKARAPGPGVIRFLQASH